MPFFPDRPCGDPGYLNTRDHSCGVDYKRFVEAHWLELEKKGILPKGKGRVDGSGCADEDDPMTEGTN